MERYNIRINMLFDDEDEIGEFTLYTPKNITVDQVYDSIIETHDYLCFDDEEELYGYQGRNPATLIDYVCEKNGWEYDTMHFDIDINLD